MSNPPTRRDRWYAGATLIGLIILGAMLFFVGSDWGLPSAWRDDVLFGARPHWTGQRVAELVHAESRWATSRAADVDVNPVPATPSGVVLNATDEQRAAIILRYRLYTAQPDEMTVLMALRAMRPSEGDFDPKLYQYGGLFLYPIGAVTFVAGKLGLIHITSDLAWYLDRPEEFAAFYRVARGAVAVFGLLGVLLCYGIARRLARRYTSPSNAIAAGLLAAALFVAMPVVIAMAHEAKPHLPATIWMLLAVYVALRYRDRPTTWTAIATGLACGAAAGTVLSSWPIFGVLVVLPFAANSSRRQGVRRAIAAAVCGVVVYLVTNPYIVINAVTKPAVLRANFANSAAMYSLSRPIAGFTNVVELMAEGMSPPLAILGIAAWLLLVVNTRRGGQSMTAVAVIGLPAALIFILFVAVGASKPGEYGRFALLPDVLTAIVVAVALTIVFRRPRVAGGVAMSLLLIVTLLFGARYVRSFYLDPTMWGTRFRTAAQARAMQIRLGKLEIGVFADPAPYVLPPVDLFTNTLIKLPADVTPATTTARPDVIIAPPDDMTRAPLQEWAKQYVDRSEPAKLPTRITWADKPFVVLVRPDVAKRLGSLE